MRITFICTGNTCRSPIAEFLCRRRLEEAGVSEIDVDSAGLFAKPGSPVVDAVVRTLAKRDIDPTPHRSKVFTSDQHQAGDLIFVMEEMHRRQILARHRIDPASVRMLGRLAPGESQDIDDPLGGPDIAYERCAERIEACVEGLLTWLFEQRIARS